MSSKNFILKKIQEDGVLTDLNPENRLRFKSVEDAWTWVMQHLPQNEIYDSFRKPRIAVVLGS